MSGLGKKVVPPAPPPEPEWRPYKKNLEINSRGQIRTCDPKNEVANPAPGWPFNPGAMPLPVEEDEDNV
jgi:hypothetical protein